MPTRKLDPNHWKRWFDDFTHGVPAAKVEIDVEGLDLGDQVEARRLPLHGITYDPRENAVYVSMPGLTHRIEDPREIHVQESAIGVQSIEIVDKDGQQHILQFRRDLALPPA